jgi:hypothetical protein
LKIPYLDISSFDCKASGQFEEYTASYDVGNTPWVKQAKFSVGIIVAPKLSVLSVQVR